MTVLTVISMVMSDTSGCLGVAIWCECSTDYRTGMTGQIMKTIEPRTFSPNTTDYEVMPWPVYRRISDSTSVRPKNVVSVHTDGDNSCRTILG